MVREKLWVYTYERLVAWPRKMAGGGGGTSSLVKGEEAWPEQEKIAEETEP